MKSWLTPILLLLAIFSFCAWNNREMTATTTHWQAQLTDAEVQADAEDWEGALTTLENSYLDWSSRQTYLHIVTEHDAVDDAEAMYRRAMAFASTEEITEFRAEISDLRDQLRLLAEMEQFSIRNVL